MIIERLKLTDFLSHAETELAFGKEDRVLIDGPSGAGKSSVVDGIVFALFGVGRVEARNLVRRGAKGCRVTLELRDGGTLWRIIRGVTAKGVQSLEVGREVDGLNVPVGEPTIREKQAFVEREVLRSSYELFSNSVLFPQSGTTFVKATASERKDLLMEIVGASDIDAFGERVKSASAKLAADLSGAANRKSTLKGVVESSEEALNVLRKASPDPETALRRVEEARAGVSAQKASIALLEAQIPPLEARAQEASVLEGRIGYLKPVVDASPEEAEKAIATWDAKAAQMTLEIAKVAEIKKTLSVLEQSRDAYLTARARMRFVDPSVDRKIEELGHRLSAILNEDLSGKKCGKCGEPYAFAVAERDRNAEQVRSDIASLTASRDEALRVNRGIEEELSLLPKVDEEALRKMRSETASEAAFVATLETAKANAAMLRDSVAKRAEAVKALADAEAAYAPLKGAKGACEEAKALLSAARRVLDMKSEALGEAERFHAKAQADAETARKAEESIRKFRKELDEARADEERLTAEASDMNLLREAFGANGIKVTVIDALVPQVEARINEVLSELSPFRVRLETQRDGAKEGKKVDGLFIDVINGEGESMDFDAFSGGEKVKITVAVSEALASLQKAQFRILDEAFVGLDAESTERFADALTKLQSRYPQLIAVSHIPEVKNIFESRILVEKKGGVSVARRV